MALTTRCLTCGTRTHGPRCRACAWQGRRKIANGWAWDQVRATIHARDRTCTQCGNTERLQVHHRVALADGGGNELSNLELLCGRCHQVRGPAPLAVCVFLQLEK